MPIVRYQINLPRDSGLPEDDVVNVLHFDSDDPPADDMPDTAARIIDFYQATQVRLSPLLSGVIKVKAYVVPNPGPGASRADYNTGPPDYVTQDTFVPGTGALPAACSAVITTHAENTGDLATPVEHRRGRFYFGLLTTGLAQGTGTGDVKIESTEAMVILNAFEAMCVGTGVGEGRLCVYSPTLHMGRPPTTGGRPGGPGPKPAIIARDIGEATFDVTRLSMDDRLDIQRRRAGRPTQRFTKAVAQ